MRLYMGVAADFAIFNLKKPLLLRREAVLLADDPQRVIINLHGGKPGVRLEPAVSDGETIVEFPVLAPRGKVKARANSFICSIYASKVRLKGVTVEERSSCSF